MLFSASFIGGVILVLRFNFCNYYVRDYFAVIGLPNFSPPYEVIIDVFGEPEKIYFPNHSPYLATVQYSEIHFIVRYDPNTSKLLNIQAVRIYDYLIRFGRRQIGVKSTRNEIIRAYRGFRGVRVNEFIREEQHVIGVIDGYTWLEFNLERDDTVKSIVIFVGGP